MSQGTQSQLQYAALTMVVLFAVAAGYSAVSGAVGDELASKDFKWDAARLLLLRQNPVALTLEGKGAPTDTIMPDKLEAQELPSALMLIAPYAVFPWPVARVLWVISNLVFTGIVLFVTFRLFAPGRALPFYMLAGALFVAGAPWRTGIAVGQHTLFSLAFFLLAFSYAERGKKTAAGVLLAFSLLKYSVTLPLFLLFVYRRHYRPIVVAFAIHLALNLMAALWLWTSPFVLLVQSYRASFMIVAGGYLDLQSFFVHSGIAEPAMVVALLQGAMVIAAVAVALRRGMGDRLLVLSVLSMISVTVFYHRPYDYVVLIFPLVWVMSGGAGLAGVMLAASVAAVFYLNSFARGVAHFLPGQPDPLTSPAYYIVVAALWYATIAVAVVTSVAPRETKADRRAS